MYRYKFSNYTEMKEKKTIIFPEKRNKNKKTLSKEEILGRATLKVVVKSKITFFRPRDVSIEFMNLFAT